jgi:hypothetical protein
MAPRAAFHAAPRRQISILQQLQKLATHHYIVVVRIIGLWQRSWQGLVFLTKNALRSHLQW